MAVGLAASGTTPLKARWRRLIGRFLFTIGAHLYAWMTWQPTWRGHCGELADLFPTQGPNGQRLRVLDLGIGPGISGIGIVDRRPAAFVLGLDYSAVMLRLAQRRLRQTKVEVSLLRGDGMALPFLDASFDVITHHSYLYLLPDTKRALAEIARVLRPGGRYVFLEPSQRGRLWALLRGPGGFRFKLSMVLWRFASRGFGRYRPEQLHALLTQHGFAEITLTPTLEALGWLGVATRIQSEAA